MGQLFKTFKTFNRCAPFKTLKPESRSTVQQFNRSTSINGKGAVVGSNGSSGSNGSKRFAPFN